MLKTPLPPRRSPDPFQSFPMVDSGLFALAEQRGRQGHQLEKIADEVNDVVEVQEEIKLFLAANNQQVQSQLAVIIAQQREILEVLKTGTGEAEKQKAKNRKEMITNVVTFLTALATAAAMLLKVFTSH